MILHPWQEEAVSRALAAPGHRFLFAEEMGLGKTGQCIETCRRLNAEKILVICPALAREGWRNEFARWWPERFAEDTDKKVGVIYASPTRKSQSKKSTARLADALNCNIRIVSPDLMDPARDHDWLVDASRGGGDSCRTAVVLDEVHYYVNADTGRSRVLEHILTEGGVSRSPILAASATPIPNRLAGLWNILNILWPGRFGFRKDNHSVPFNFLDAYCERVITEKGTAWGGLRADRADELKARLAQLMSRTTRKEVRARWPGLLPAAQLRALPIETGGANKNAITASKAWCIGALAESSHVAVLTNLRATAEDIAQMLQSVLPDVRVTHVDGSVPPAQRNAMIAGLRTAPTGILVTTMHAVAEAISLSWCHRALFAELYWRPKTLVQTVGRFPRLDGDTDIIIDVLCGAGSAQAKMAMVLADKLIDAQKVIPAGAADEGLIGALSGDNMEAEILRAASASIGDAWDDGTTVLED